MKTLTKVLTKDINKAKKQALLDMSKEFEIVVTPNKRTTKWLSSKLLSNV
jgi:hypothetical protein